MGFETHILTRIILLSRFVAHPIFHLAHTRRRSISFLLDVEGNCLSSHLISTRLVDSLPTLHRYFRLADP
jgi:hypothetical protein